MKEELRRIRQGLRPIVECTTLPVSIDTRYSSVAEEALRMGAAIINDTSGLRADSEMAKLAADNAAPIVLMANCGRPCPSADSALEALSDSRRIALNAGVKPDRIIFDPGIGFGKPVETDCTILRHLRTFKLLGQPLLVGVSRKAFIGNLLGLPDPGQRLIGTIAATSIAVLNGADIIRAHDVGEARIAAKIGEALRAQASTIGDRVEILQPYNERDAELLIRRVGASSEIAGQLANKALTLGVMVTDVLTPAALILKQEMLALGGDAAYHYDVIDHKTDRTDVLMMGTPLQLAKLVKKISAMGDFGLNEIGTEIRDIMNRRRSCAG